MHAVLQGVEGPAVAIIPVVSCVGWGEEIMGTYQISLDLVKR